MALERVFLVGMMGSGKTAVGKILASLLGWKFMDTDHIVEKRERTKIHVLFRTKGEKYFRKAEAGALKVASREKYCVIATGGGIVLKKENWRRMRAAGHIVYLEARPSVLVERLTGRERRRRPLLSGGDLLPALRKIFHQRRTIYRQADLSVRSEMPPEKVAGLVVKKLKHLLIVF